ncbi:hypothetical protein WS73_23615 [Burkholderia savannae]|nr:hypothetical protein WS73_23615 [Burkholderia savannae]
MGFRPLNGAIMARPMKACRSGRAHKKSAPGDRERLGSGGEASRAIGPLRAWREKARQCCAPCASFE